MALDHRALEKSPEAIYDELPVRDMIMSTGAFVFSALALLAAKIWYRMELNTNSMTRDVERVELQIAHLA